MESLVKLSLPDIIKFPARRQLYCNIHNLTWLLNRKQDRVAKISYITRSRHNQCHRRLTLTLNTSMANSFFSSNHMAQLVDVDIRVGNSSVKFHLYERPIFRFISCQLSTSKVWRCNALSSHVAFITQAFQLEACMAIAQHLLSLSPSVPNSFS